MNIEKIDSGPVIDDTIETSESSKTNDLSSIEE